MKKILAMALAIAMILGTMGTTVFAEDTVIDAVSEQSVAPDVIDDSELSLLQAAADDVAQIGAQGYKTFAEAAAQAQTGDEITLIADCSLSSGEVTLDGVNLTATGGAKLTVGEGTTLNFSNGSLTDINISGAGTTVFGGDVNFYGTNTAVSGINGSSFELIVNKGATLLISRFVLGYNRNITVYGNVADAHSFDPAGQTPSLKFNSSNGASIGGTGGGRITAENAYIEFDNSSWKNCHCKHEWNFDNCYVSATSFGNNNEPGSADASWNVTFDNSVLVAKNYIKTGKNVTYNFTNGSTATTGSLRNDGAIYIDKTSSVKTTAQQNNVAGTADEHGGNNGTINVSGTLDIGSTSKTQFEMLGGTLNIDSGAKLELNGNSLTLDASSKLASAGSVNGAITGADGAKIQITGGTYTQDVKDWCVGGFACEDNGDGSFGVKELPGRVTTFDKLKAILGTEKEIYIAEDITVDEAITIPQDTTVTVPADKKLRVLDTLTNNGIINGEVISSVMVYVTETVNHYGGVTYEKRATKNGAIAGNAPASVKYEISLDGGNSWFADTVNGNAQAVTVKTDGTVAVSNSFQSAFTSAKTGETVHMLKDVHVVSTNPKKNNGPLRSYYGLILEGNGHTIFTDLEPSGASNEYATIKFTSYLAGTGPEVNPVLKNVTIDSRKNAKADLDYVSGDVTFTVTMYNVNLLGNCQYANFAMKSSSLIINKSNTKIYDSVIPSWDAGSAKAIDIYSGTYSLSLNSKCTVYGGTYTKDVTAYLADGVGIEKNADGTYTALPGMVAQIGNKYYASLQEAIDAAVDGDIICLIDKCDENVTVSQKPDVMITIDGKQKTMSGAITVDGRSARYATAGLTIKNVNFDAGNISKDACINLGGNNNIRYTSNVTVTDCTFTGTDMTKVGVKQYTGGCHNLIVTKCEAEGMHSLMQLKNVEKGLAVSDCVVEDCKNGISIGKSTGVLIEKCTIKATGYGIRADGEGEYTAVAKDCTVEANQPVVVRKTSADYTLTLEGNNNLTATGTDVYQVVFTKGDDGTCEMPESSFNFSGAKGLNVFPENIGVAQIGDTLYNSLQLAVDVGGEITLLADVSENITLADGSDAVIDLNGKTMTGCILPCNPARLTVKNGSIKNEDAFAGAIEINAGELVLEDVNVESAGDTVKIGGSAKVVINSGNYTSIAGKARATYYAITVSDTANVTVNDGKFAGALAAASTASLAIKGGIFDHDPSAFVADGYIAHKGASLWRVGKYANWVYVQFRKTDVDANKKDNLEGADEYEIILAADNDINELASADITFDFDVIKAANGGDIDYNIVPATGVTLTKIGHRHMFNYDGVTKYEDSGKALVIGTVTIGGYGEYSLTVDKTAATNAVYATKIIDSLVDGFVPAAGLVVNEEMEAPGEADDGMIGKIGATIAVPVRKLTIDIDFNNPVVYAGKDYQDMTVIIDGGTYYEEIKLGDKAEDDTIVRELPKDISYTVTVKGAGYRTARYTVSLTDNKNLKFWNNVMDEQNAICVEEGKDDTKETVTFLAGDIVKDNKINIYDLSAVVAYFGTTGLSAANNPEYARYDLNRDGVIDSKDVAYVLVSWGK